MTINLISDTVTKPSPEMLQYMMAADVGDDVFRADPTVNRLEERVAQMFGMDASLYCPSGTMTNQIAIKTHTQPLDELICDHYSHVYQSEAGGYAFNSGVSISLIEGTNGKITADQISACIKNDYDWLPNSKLVVLENSCNIGGGSYYTLSEIAPITKLCKENKLSLHLDGARLFNVLAETGESTLDVGKHFDSISICISKGLGAPVGSLLIGSQSFIKKARKFRKVMGGGMRQAGYLAAACIYALENNIDRLKEDNNRASTLGKVLSEMPYVDHVRPVKTNIVFFDIKEGWTGDQFIEYLKTKNILAVAFGPKTLRFVTHLNVTENMINEVVETLKSIPESP